MTKEIYEQRKNDLIKGMAEWGKAGRYNEARVTYGRLCELIDISYCIEDTISAEQYHADHKQVSDCFYDNLKEITKWRYTKSTSGRGNNTSPHSKS